MGGGGRPAAKQQKSVVDRWVQARCIERTLDEPQVRAVLAALLSGVHPARAVLSARTWFRSSGGRP